jgi:hypothetical protein
MVEMNWAIHSSVKFRRRKTAKGEGRAASAPVAVVVTHCSVGAVERRSWAAADDAKSFLKPLIQAVARSVS